MNASAFAQRAYGLSSPSAKSPKETEYQVFARVTGGLIRARDDGGIQAAAHTIHDNNRLWTTLAADLMHDDNALPVGLRAQLLSLAQFSILHGAAVLRGDAELDALIDVNHSIMKGLRGAEADAA